MMANAKHIRMIEQEFSKACEKHPKFCDIITRKSERYLARLETFRKKHTTTMFKRKQVYSAELILDEEIKEALHSYKQGDREHCLQELAQCGAVILRMMQYVEEVRWAHGDTCKGGDNEKAQS